MAESVIGAGERAAGGDEVDRGLGVDAAFAVDVVGVAVLVAAAARRRCDRRRSTRSASVAAVEVAAQRGLRRQHQGEGAGDVRRGHGRAGEGLVAATGHARDDVDAGGGDVRVDLAERGRAAARELGDLVVDIGGAGAERLEVVAGRAALAAERAGVAGREDRDDPGGAPGLDDLEIERAAGTAAPGVVHDVGALGAVGVLAR